MNQVLTPTQVISEIRQHPFQDVLARFGPTEKPMTFTPTVSRILMALQFAPYVAAAVQQVEATNAALPGETKKAIVLMALAARVSDQAPDAQMQIIGQVVSSLIDLLVGVLFPHDLTAPVK